MAHLYSEAPASLPDFRVRPVSVVPTEDQSEGRFLRRGKPQLFIVVANNGRTDQLREGLSRLLPTARAYGAQVLVVGPATPNKVYDLIREHAGIRYVMTHPGLSRTDLLSLGVAETGGGVVVLTDAAGLHDQDWPRILALRLGMTEESIVPRVRSDTWAS
jgi:hypothetical protein